MTSRTTCIWRQTPMLMLAISSSIAHALTPSQVFEAVKDSVVVVKALDFMGNRTNQGSGVLLPGGRIATNCHVIKDGLNFQVGSGKQFVAATLYAGDDDKDICLLETKGVGGKPAIMGKAVNLKVGEPVYAVGAPQGLELSLSDGIVSQLRGGSPPFIQTTAAISPGSSGGGLFDSKAQLVGFTTLYIDGGQSLNFAMPVEWLAEIRPDRKSTKQGHNQPDWWSRAAALEENKDWAGLLVWSRQWIKSEPKSASALFELGMAYRNLHRSKDAIDAYRKALRINPEHSAAWNNLGYAYDDEMRYTDAIDAYRQALRINPENDIAWSNIGGSYYKLKRPGDAIDAFREALRINPENGNAWNNLGVAYLGLNRNIDAVYAYRQAVRINPDNDKAWNDLGGVYGRLDRYDDAIYAYLQALSIDSEDTVVWENLGKAYGRIKRYNDAIYASRKAVSIDPKNAGAWNDLALSYYFLDSVVTR